MQRILWAIAGTVLSGLSLFFVDQSLSTWLATEENAPFRRAAREITDFGLGEHWFLLALVVYVMARWVSPSKFGFLKNTAIHLFVALLGSGLILRILKWAIGRQRPHVGDLPDAFVFQPFSHHWHYQSMPSGHSQVLFAVATTFVLLWPRWTAVIYILAGVMSLTRVVVLQHFLSDVIVGMMTGYFGTLLVRQWLAHRIPLPEPLRFQSSGFKNSAK